METRNIKITLEKAKEWYNSGSDELREIALQAYTEEELHQDDWKNIKTFEDACMALGMAVSTDKIYASDYLIKRHLKAIYKLDIIQRALNGDWKPSLVKGGQVYYPHVEFYPADEAKKAVDKEKGRKVGGSFHVKDKEYTIVGGGYRYCLCDGLSDFCDNCGSVLPNMGLLGCRSREIAKHMSSYFSKEIFMATYSQYYDLYEWI